MSPKSPSERSTHSNPRSAIALSGMTNHRLRRPLLSLERKAFLVNYRAGDGRRKAPNKRVVVGRAGRVTLDQAKRRAQELLGRAVAGEDPAGGRAEARGLPRLGETCEEYIKSSHGWAVICGAVSTGRFSQMGVASESGHVEEPQAHYEAIGQEGGARF